MEASKKPTPRKAARSACRGNTRAGFERSFMAISFPFAGLQAQCHGQHKGRDNQRPAQQGRAECGNVAVANGIVGNAVVPVGIRVLAPVPCSDSRRVRHKGKRGSRRSGRPRRTPAPAPVLYKMTGSWTGEMSSTVPARTATAQTNSTASARGITGNGRNHIFFLSPVLLPLRRANPGKTDGRTDRRENGPP